MEPFAPITEQDYVIYNRWNATHHIQRRAGTKVTLALLKDHQSVCYGDGKTYHYLLTRKAPPQKPARLNMGADGEGGSMYHFHGESHSF